MIGIHPMPDQGLYTCEDNGWTPVLTNVKIYNNKFHGDMSMVATAFLFSNGCTSGVEIYNNEFYLNDSSGDVNTTPGFIAFGQRHINADPDISYDDGNYSITNNTLSSDAYPGKDRGAGQAISGNLYGTNVIKNNIFSGFGIDISAWPVLGGTIAVDYNMHNVSNVTGYGYPVMGYATLHDAQAAGYDVNGKGSCLTSSPWTCTYNVNYPGFVTPSTGTSEPDLHLLVTSPAKGAGIGISGQSYDKDGVAWSSPPSIGAYGYAGADTTPPTLTSATIPSGGSTVSLLFSEIVTRVSETGWAMTMTGGAVTMTYNYGSGTSTLVYTLSRPVNSGQTGTVAWTAQANTIEDAVGNDLASIATLTVTNNSTQGLNAPAALSGLQITGGTVN
jgi:hypothetical protein